MILGVDYLYYYGPDKSRLYEAWNKYYAHLSYNKRLKIVYNKVLKGKMPPLKQ